jgi:Mg/Co/Ni transporter MgtE
MIYKQKFYFLCKTPLSAEGPEDVEVLEKADKNENFPELFQKYEDYRSHAFNEDRLYSIVRADDIFDLIRTTNEKAAKELAFENAQPEIITNLQHRVMQKKDKNAKAILKEVHGVES